LVSGGPDDGIKLWDLASGNNIGTFRCRTSVRRVVFSPDGKTVAVAGGSREIELWDVNDKTEIATLSGHTRKIGSVAFSPSGTILASGGWDNTVRLWEVASGKNTATLDGHTNFVTCVAFTPDGTTLASGSADGKIRLWDGATGKNTAVLDGYNGKVRCLAYSPDGKTLAWGTGDSLLLWDTVSGKKIAQLKHGATWALVTGRDPRRFPAARAEEVFSLAFGPDGKTVASGNWGHTIKLWDVATGKNTAFLFGHTGHVRSVAFSPDGKTLASGSSDKTIKLWDLKTCKTNDN
jgi:WD40 repeat protein